MARKSHHHRFDLPSLELACMKALWALGTGTVHEIRARLLAERSLAYTTVLTLMDRLTRKGVVTRQKRGRAHVYRPLVSEEQVRHQALDRLVGHFFQGSRLRLRQYLEAGGRRPLRPRAEVPARARETTPRVPPPLAIDPTLL